MTATSVDTAVSVKLAPHLCFYGKAGEALDFYAQVFGGTYHAMRWTDAGGNCNIPAANVNEIMHAEFSAPGITLLANDGNPNEPAPEAPRNDNQSLTLYGTDIARGKELFDALAQGGNVIMPLEQQFWGDHFGLLTDRYGIQWMVNVGPGGKQG